jgi:hypothetical protein
MARRDANLAGLAALGALGYALSKGKDGKNMAPVEDRGTYLDKALSDTDAATGQGKYRAEADTSDLEIEKNVGLGSPKAPSTPKAAPPKKAAPKMMSRDEEAKIRATGGPRGVLYSPTDTGDDLERMKRRGYQAAIDKAASPEGKAARKAQEEGQAVENMTGDFLPIGRVGKMLGNAAKSAKEAISSGSREIAKRASEYTPVEFLGASGRRAVDQDLLPGSGRALTQYKKGGAVKAKPAKAAKPAAKGWGQARGARGAKYY